jgi:hypothetical protein
MSFSAGKGVYVPTPELQPWAKCHAAALVLSKQRVDFIL